MQIQKLTAQALAITSTCFLAKGIESNLPPAPESAMTLSASGTKASPKSPSNLAPERQFDFWLGEWDVLNRHLMPGGEWVEGSTTKARYTPVAGGMGLLEEWYGPFSAGVMCGFSLRAWNPAIKQWEIALFWTADGRGNFGAGAMRGEFRHGRGEFFSSSSGSFRTRFTFSDALANSVRWDSSTTEDKGMNWNTNWIMEFSRTRDASEMSQDRLFGSDWSPGKLSPNARARDLDKLLGSWEGVQLLTDGTELEARLRAKLVSKDCLIVDLLETRSAPEDDWQERLFVRGLCSPAQAWEAWCVSESDPGLRKYARVSNDEGVTFEHASDDRKTKEREIITILDDDWIVIETEIQQRGMKAGTLISTTELRRTE